MKLYHYTSIKNFASIWQSQALKFSESKGTNDYFERLKIITADNGVLKYNGEETEMEVLRHNINSIYHKINEYKQISLSMDNSQDLKGYASPMMWGLYSRSKDDNGNWQDGVCIELDKSKLDLESKPLYSKAIIYEDNVQAIKLGGNDFSGENAIEKFIDINQDLIFFTKHRHWEHENEYRIVSNNLDYLDISDAITGVYVLGMDSPSMKEVEKVTQNPSIINVLISSGINGITLSKYNLQKFRDIIQRNTKKKNKNREAIY